MKVSKIKSGAEIDTLFNDDNKLVFAIYRSRVPYLVGALLLTLAVTGGIFAFGFINATTTLAATTVNSNFADVSVNTTGIAAITWNAFGFFKGSIAGPNSIFNITPAAGYAGGLATTVTLGNADQLVKQYRLLALQLEMVDFSTNATLDINDDGAAGADDWVMLTLTTAPLACSLITAPSPWLLE